MLEDKRSTWNMYNECECHGAFRSKLSFALGRYAASEQGDYDVRAECR